MFKFQSNLASKYIKNKFQQFVLREDYPNPQIFFIIFLYNHIEIQMHLSSINIVTFIGAIILLNLNYNILFMIAPFIGVNPFAGILMFLICLCGCTQKWKLYLFIFTIGGTIFQDNSKQIFICLFSLFIYIQSYRITIFKSIQDNVTYCTGFTGILACYILKLVFRNLNLQSSPILQISIALIAMPVGYRLINQRIQQIKDLNPYTIKKDRIMARYLEILQYELGYKLLAQVLMKMHTMQCQESSCFCGDQQLHSKPNFHIRQIYLYAIRTFATKTRDLLLADNYIDFLLRIDQPTVAIFFLSQWKPKYYWQWIAYQKSISRISQFIKRQNMLNIYEKQYEYALAYDLYCRQMRVQINEILSKKIKFWSQVARQNPSVLRLQTLGYSIVNKMTNLNKFYNQEIKIYEKQIYSFDSTVIYAMYLLSTTNFKDYAQEIIKKTAKLLQQANHFEGSYSQVFSIRTVVVNLQKIHQQKEELSLEYLNMNDNSSTKQQNKQIKHAMIIDAVSNGLCKMINVEKCSLIGQQLNVIIPDGYKQVHNVRLSYLLDINNYKITDIVSSKVMHQELKLPLKSNEKQLFIAQILIKYQPDIQKGLSFMSIIKIAQDKSSTALINFNCELAEVQKGFPLDILNHIEIQRYLLEMKLTWQKEKIVKEEIFSLINNSNNYLVNISSPLLGLFVQKENLINKSPPIHIKVSYQEQKNVVMPKNKCSKTALKINQMSKQMALYDHMSSSARTKNSGLVAINILFVFSQAKNIPIYKLLQIVFSIVMLVCVVSNLGGYFSSNLAWDPSLQIKNPIYDIIYQDYTQLYNIKVFSQLIDDRSYDKNKQIMNLTRINEYHGGNYEREDILDQNNLQQKIKKNILNVIKYKSSFLNLQALQKKYQINLTNINKNYPYRDKINITSIQLNHLFASDINLIKKQQLNKTIISQIYNIEHFRKNRDFDESEDSGLISLVDQSLNATQNKNRFVSITLIPFITLLIIPLFYFFRIRLALHEKLFDLFTSIETDQVEGQIKSLKYIINIVRNHKESGQQLKGNVLGYQENVINPKPNNPRKGSMDNQIVMGLQKYNLQNNRQKLSNIQDQVKYNNQSAIKENNKSRKNFASNQTLISAIKSQFSSQGFEKIVTRKKRAGQLSIQNSFLDPRRKVIWQHCIIYCLCLSFVIIIALNIILNSNYISFYKGQIHKNNQVVEMQLQFELLLLQTKNQILEPISEDLEQDLNQIFQQIQELYPEVNQIMQNSNNWHNIIPKCSQQKIKLCQYDNSYIIMKGQFFSLIKNLIGLKKSTISMTDQNHIKEIEINIVEKVFYLQVLSDNMQKIIFDYVHLVNNNLLNKSKEYYSIRLMLLLISIGWGIFCLIIGLCLINKMKQNYMKEVQMITFLNSDMIQKNKRIESFIQSISNNNNN